MNKKFFTLLVASGLMATAVNAQTTYCSTAGVPAGGSRVDARFPYTPFGSTMLLTTPISKLENINKGAEAVYY
ncbi:MAG: hypothetical protein LUD46_02190 [Parabacteroides sp.]|nr:hypothetical protein [Parabacteroides sp.]